MLTAAQKKAVVDSWAADSPAANAFAMSRDRGASPQDCAATQAKALRLGAQLQAAGIFRRDQWILEGIMTPEELAIALEAGEFDQEIAAKMGYT